jgi:hypothetical protein
MEQGQRGPGDAVGAVEGRELLEVPGVGAGHCWDRARLLKHLGAGPYFGGPHECSSFEPTSSNRQQQATCNDTKR